jgi:hypothetical protein
MGPVFHVERLILNACALKSLASPELYTGQAGNAVQSRGNPFIPSTPQAVSKDLGGNADFSLIEWHWDRPG